ncbi:CYTH and CHAD domain-containing protein [Roseomonas gilardii]|uniref:CYTH and CHAD domain-containing protein n=1 Tax=Roseomonas gilardii TaxID=257708 RepID=UPI0011AA85A4|nr:CYTH and CHAD domain-containing protein [Roseomonas gilardii]
MADHDEEAPRELEIKLLLPDGYGDTFPDLDAFRGLIPAERHQVTTYFDTTDRRLLKEGMALRLRRGGARTLQTLKTASDGSTFGRSEWEAPVEGKVPDLALLRGTPAEPLLPEGTVLKPVFETRVRRLRCDLAPGKDVRIEAVLDLGEIRAGRRREPIREMELELQQGSAIALYRLASEVLLAVPGALLSTESKAARGWQLAAKAPRRAEKAGEVTLRPEMTVAEAVRAVIGSCLRQLMANEPLARTGAADGSRMEGVHQMRVAIRRLRAGLRLFGPLLEPRATARFEGELRRLGQVLGAARDWDVFCEETLPEAGKEEGAAEWIALLRPAAEECRAEAHADMLEELRRPTLGALVLGLAGWVEDPAVLGGAAVGKPLAEVAPELLEGAARKVRRRGRKIQQRSMEELHGLRKALKRLRYGLEFLSGLCPEKALRRYLQGCKELQEDLGKLNDAVTATAMAEKLVTRRGTELAPAMAGLAQWAEARRAAAVARLPADWKAFRDLPLPLED